MYVLSLDAWYETYPTSDNFNAGFKTLFHNQLVRCMFAAIKGQTPKWQTV